MRPLNYELKQLGVHNRDGSFATQANRAYMLSLMADQLHALGYTQLHAHDLKGRHVNALLRLWQEHALAPGTVKNRLAALRWWAEKVGRPRVVQAGNAPYGVPKRQYGLNIAKLSYSATYRILTPSSHLHPNRGDSETL